MSCAGSEGNAKESTCQHDCRMAWYSAVTNASNDYAQDKITFQEWATAVDDANTALQACKALC